MGPPDSGELMAVGIGLLFCGMMTGEVQAGAYAAEDCPALHHSQEERQEQAVGSAGRPWWLTKFGISVYGRNQSWTRPSGDAITASCVRADSRAGGVEKASGEAAKKSRNGSEKATNRRPGTQSAHKETKEKTEGREEERIRRCEGKTTPTGDCTLICPGLRGGMGEREMLCEVRDFRRSSARELVAFQRPTRQNRV